MMEVQFEDSQVFWCGGEGYISGLVAVIGLMEIERRASSDRDYLCDEDV